MCFVLCWGSACLFISCSSFDLLPIPGHALASIIMFGHAHLLGMLPDIEHSSVHRFHLLGGTLSTVDVLISTHDALLLHHWLLHFFSWLHCIPIVNAFHFYFLSIQSISMLLRFVQVVTSSLYLLSDIYVPGSCLERGWRHIIGRGVYLWSDGRPGVLRATFIRMPSVCAVKCEWRHVSW